MLPSINPIPGYVWNGLIFSNGLSHNYACPHDLMRYFLNTKCFQRGINSSKSWESLVYLKWRLRLMNLWLARWVCKRENPTRPRYIAQGCSQQLQHLGNWLYNSFLDQLLWLSASSRELEQLASNGNLQVSWRDLVTF